MLLDKNIEKNALDAIDRVCFQSKPGKQYCFPDIEYGFSQNIEIYVHIAYEFFDKHLYVIDLVDPTSTTKISLLKKDKDKKETPYELEGVDFANDEYDLNSEYFAEGLNRYIDTHPSYIYVIYDKSIVFTEDYIFLVGKFEKQPRMYAFSRYPEMDKELISSIIKIEKPDEASIKWLSVNSQGYIVSKNMEIKNVDIDCCYNDFPEDKITELINSDKSELIIFRGKPGTGKTSALRYIINKFKNVDFFWLDICMFSKINDFEFQEFLLEHKNGVYIMEDCESILKSRDSDYNSMLSSLLNITDGMLGDDLKNKFICTFNTDFKNIDKALLRKGRLSLLYEFDLLKADNANKLLKKLNKNHTTTKEMALCDIFNLEDDNGQETVERKTIGF